LAPLAKGIGTVKDDCLCVEVPPHLAKLLRVEEGSLVIVDNVSAWRQFVLFEFARYYKVSVPDAGLPDGIDIEMRVASDGVPDPLVYEPIDR
jgi:hypothetical protein